MRASVLKWIAIACLIFLCMLGAAAAGIAAWVQSPDFQASAVRFASQALGRKITARNLQIQWTNPLVIAMDDLHVANPSWGSEADMLRIGHIAAQIELQPLMQGRLQYHTLRISGLDMLLERNADGIGNWKFDNTPRPAHSVDNSGGLAVIPKNRTQFPVLLDMQMTGSLIRYRTSSGKILRIAADRFAMSSPSDHQPVRLVWQGSYNNMPAVMAADMESYADLRDGVHPYQTHLTINLANSKLDYRGTMMEPLDADGDEGQLEITTSRLGEVLEMLGIEQPSSLVLDISGPFTRDGDHSHWNNTEAHLADNHFGGDIALDEGARAQPDTMSFNFLANKMNLKSIWDGIAAGPKTQAFDFKAETNLFLTLRLLAKELIYGRTHVFDANALLAIKPGEVALRPSSFIYMGGQANAFGNISGERNSLQFTANASLTGADLAALSKAFGMPGVLAGQFDMAGNLEMSGKVLDTALTRNSKGGLVLSVSRGTVQKDFIEKSAVDLRNLFRREPGKVPIECMIGVINIRNGIGKVTPLQLRTADGGLGGGGQVDISHQRLDMMLKSDAARSGFFALDIPLRISGPFSNIIITPVLGVDEPGIKPKNISIPADLPPQLQPLAAVKSCLR